MLDPESGSTFPLGTTTVLVTATDSAGNTAEDTFTVTVRDTTAPTITSAGDITAAPTSAAGADVTWPPPLATDLVDGDDAVTCAPASGDAFSLGVTPVTCTANDAAGNTATITFTVTVAYAWSGVLQPVNADGSSVFTGGSTVPVKFRLVGDSSEVADAVATLSHAKISNGVVGDQVEAVSTAAATTGNEFRFDTTTAQYVFNWKTTKQMQGTYQLCIDLGGGLARTVLVSVR